MELPVRRRPGVVLGVTLPTSPYRDEVQVPVDPETMEPLPARE